MEKPFATVINTAQTALLCYAQRPQWEELLAMCSQRFSSTTVRLLLGSDTTEQRRTALPPGDAQTSAPTNTYSRT